MKEEFELGGKPLEECGTFNLFMDYFIQGIDTYKDLLLNKKSTVESLKTHLTYQIWLLENVYPLLHREK